jgi:hypothetical protein
MGCFIMQRIAQTIIGLVLLIATSLLLFPSTAEAVPSYTRRYGFDCNTCHTMWGALNAAGVTFRLSGYRAIFGKDIVPIEENHDIDIPGVNVKIPATLPLSFVTGVGYDQRSEKRTAFDGTVTTRRAATGALEDASIFLTAPIGDRFAAFVEFPMYETRAWEFTPVGQSGITADGSPGGANDKTAFRNFQFNTEKPIFEVAKFFWNNLLGDNAPRDSVNGLVGITHLPLAYSPGKVRLSVNQYPIYEYRALELLSPIHTTFMGGANDLFRLSEPQILGELNGMWVPGGAVTDSAKKETFWLEYHLGTTTAHNDATNNNGQFGGYGRLVGRYYNQSLGVFGFYKGDTYDDALRDPATSAFVINQLNGVGGIINTGIFNPLAPRSANSATALGVDGTLSLAPWGIPVSLDNQYMWRRESNPTGFNQAFTWQGGFNQLNWFITPQVVTYGRYDWIQGSRFNDTPFGGITFSDPRQHDFVAGIQYAPWQNVKLIGEYRYRVFQDRAVGTPADLAGCVATCQPYLNRSTTASIVDNGFTARLMMGF